MSNLVRRSVFIGLKRNVCVFQNEIFITFIDSFPCVLGQDRVDRPQRSGTGHKERWSSKRRDVVQEDWGSYNRQGRVVRAEVGPWDAILRRVPRSRPSFLTIPSSSWNGEDPRRINSPVPTETGDMYTYCLPYSGGSTVSETFFVL